MSGRFQQHRSNDEPIPGYHLIRFLGKGNFGEVWMAAAPGNKKVALKFIDLRGREGVLESKAIERIKDINHPHLVSIFAYWLIDSQGQILDDTAISELSGRMMAKESAAALLGGTMTFSSADRKIRPAELVVAMTLGSANLSDVLEQYRSQGLAGIPVETLLDFMEDAGKGLDYLNSPIHDHGEGKKPIIHGDVKPQNLLLVGDSLQICDFGLAREIDDLRKTGTAMGTYAYAAPELLTGHPHVRSDQYCLAVSYIELRTGTLPVGGETNILKIAEMHRDGKLDMSGLGPAEAKVIRKALQPDPQQRWGTCKEMVRALRRAIDTNVGDVDLQTPLIARTSLFKLKDTSASIPKADTVPTGLAGRRIVRFLRRTAAVVLVAAMMGCAAWWGWLYVGGPTKDSPEWFAAQFTDVTNSLPPKPWVSSEAMQRVLAARERVTKVLEPRWSGRVKEEVGNSHFAEADRILAAASSEADLLPTEEIRAEWERVAGAWKGVETKAVEMQQYAAAAQLINDFLPQAVFPPQKYGNFASREKIIEWQQSLCAEETTRLTGAIGEYLAASTTIGSLEERAQAIDGIATLPEDAKATYRKSVAALAIVRLKKLAGPEDYDYAEALRELSKMPANLLSEGDRATIKNEFLQGLAGRVRSLVEGGDAKSAADLLARCGDLIDNAFRQRLGKELQSVWTKAILATGDNPDAAQEQLDKYRSLASELRDQATWNAWADKIRIPGPVQQAPDLTAQIKTLLQQIQPAYDGQKFPEARAKLTAARQLLAKSPDVGFEHHIRVWEAAIGLFDAASSSAERRLAVATSQDLLDKPAGEATAAWRRLALAFASALLECPAGHGSKQLPLAIKAVRRASESGSDPTIKAALTSCLARLWERKIEQFISAGEAPLSPTKEEYHQFVADWGKIDDKSRRSAQVALIEAWQCECRLAFEPETSPNELSEESSLPYVHYVRLLVAAARDHLIPQEAIAELMSACGKPERQREYLAVPTRTKQLVAWTSTAVRGFCEVHASPGLLGNPFGDSDGADRCYPLLIAIRDIMAAAPPAAQQWKPDEERMVLDYLGAAAVWKKPLDLATARASSSAWSHLPNGYEAAEMVLYTAALGRLPEKSAVPAANDADLVKVSTLLLQTLTEHIKQNYSGRVDSISAKTIYGNFLEPVLQRTDALRGCNLPSEQRTELGNFYVAAYDFVSQDRRAWHVADPSVWIDNILNSAIELKSARSVAGSIAVASVPVADAVLRRLYRDRAQRRLEGEHTDLESLNQVINDGSCAGASDLLSDALGRRALVQEARDKILADIEAAIAEGKKAETAYGKLALSQAYILRANYDNDPHYFLESRGMDLDAAVASIKVADTLRQQRQVEGVPDFPDYLYHLAAGNAYEDLAWLVEKDPPADYMNQAIREFGLAAKASPSEPQPHCSIGRCYVKSLAESYLPVDRLKKRNGAPLRNEFGVMDECEMALKAALDREPSLVEANAYLGQLYQLRGAALYALYADDPQEKKAQDWLREATKWFGEAEKQHLNTWELAQKPQRGWKQGLPYRAYYAVAWVQFPLSDIRLDAQKRKATVRERLPLLDKVPVPPGGIQDPKKEKAWIDGFLSEMDGDNDAALRHYTEALPADLSAATCADSRLFVARAACRLKIAAAKKTQAPVEAAQEAEQALADAEAAQSVAFFLSGKVIALEQKFNVHTFLYRIASAEDRNRRYGEFMKDFKALLTLAPRRPNESQWYATTAAVLLVATKSFETGLQHDDAPQRLQDCLNGYANTIVWVSQAVDKCKGTQARKRLKEKLLKPFIASALAFANNHIESLPQDSPVRADFGNKIAAWNELKAEP